MQLMVSKAHQRKAPFVSGYCKPNLNMNTSLILVFSLLLAFFAGALLLLKILPIFIARQRAKVLGLELSWKESSVVQKNFCNKQEFFIGAKEILELTDVPIERITNHFLAGGNLENIKNGISELQRRNKEVSFSMLAAIDLTGRDLKTEINNADVKETVIINGLTNGKIEVDYKASYTYDFPNSVFGEKSVENLSQKIRVKLMTFLGSWEDTDSIKTEFFLRENILPIGYWESDLKRILVKQEFSIKNNSR